jgi:hypothetical protein
MKLLKTHTTLFGFEILYNLTAAATRTSPSNSLTSPEVMFSPPGGKLDLVLPGV